MNKIPIGLNETFAEMGIYADIYWNPEECCHVLVVGGSGSGKTYFCKLLLGNIMYTNYDAQLYIANYKGDCEFGFLNLNPRYYCYIHCAGGIDAIYQKLLDRQDGTDTTRNLIIFYFDEYTSFLNSMEKKESELYRTKIATLLMLGRSFHINVIISIQRADAALFSLGSRDNFGIVAALGNLSKESKQMLFPDYKEYMLPDRKRGTGSLTINGTQFQPFIVPTVYDIQKLHAYIQQGIMN